MAVQNLYTYTETDPNSRLTLTQSKVTYAGLLRNEDAYTYKDFGVDYFASDFRIDLTIDVTAADQDSTCAFWAVANVVDDWDALQFSTNSSLSLATDYPGTQSAPDLRVWERDGSSGYNSGTYRLVIGTIYYVTIIRDESVGTFGTLYGYIYSDAARTNLLQTLSVALHTSKKDFRYLFAVMSRNITQTQSQSGYVENISILTSLNPVVSQQSLTAIAPTTATGHGTITSLGASAVTEHGHCWNTATAPTTANSKTTNGAGAVGTFTSAITGLTAGTKYYVRAYATNTQGTAYSDELSFTSGSPIQSTKGKLFVKGTELHYVDNSGIERKLEGTVV